MITITIKNDSIKAVGHAEYRSYGNDIVCSAVSCLLQTLELRGKATKSSGNMIVQTEDKEALKLISEGLKQIAENYPLNVEVLNE